MPATRPTSPFIVWMRRDWWRQMPGQSIRRETATASRPRMRLFALRTCGQDWYWLGILLPALRSLRSPGAVAAEPVLAGDIPAEARLAEALGRAPQVARAVLAAARE